MKKFSKKRVWIVTVALAICFVSAALIGLFHVSDIPVSAPTSQVSASVDNGTDSEGNDTVSSVKDDTVLLEETVRTTCVISSLLAGMSQEELIENSTLIMKATLIDKSSGFQIEAVYGGKSIFTDYYFEPEEILRGEAENSPVTVRINEGIADGIEVINETPYGFEIGGEYVLFLYAPSYGGGYNTEGDYYYVTGAQQGVFRLDSVQSRSTDEVYQSVIFEDVPEETIRASDELTSFVLSDFSEEIAAMNESAPPQEDLDYQKFLEAQQENLESGFISQEEYDRFIWESQQYATYVGDPPAGYSGSEE